MRVFITGAEGFIGKNFIQQLPDDWVVSSYDLIDNPDLRPRDLNIEGNDWVLHLGALSSTTETDARRVMDLNLAWSIELAEECEKYGVNMQWASSASVYGNKYRCAVNESHDCRPLNLYAHSKYFFEEYMKSRSPEIIWQGFRYFNVYGPHEEHKGSQGSPYSQFARQAKETGVIKIFEGSENLSPSCRFLLDLQGRHRQPFWWRTAPHRETIKNPVLSVLAITCGNALERMFPFRSSTGMPSVSVTGLDPSAPQVLL